VRRWLIIRILDADDQEIPHDHISSIYRRSLRDSLLKWREALVKGDLKMTTREEHILSDDHLRALVDPASEATTSIYAREILSLREKLERVEEWAKYNEMIGTKLAAWDKLRAILAAKESDK